MREIKFRVWDNIRNVIRPKTALAFNKEGALLFDYETLMQYTGLKDKNDVEIYEGDIVKVVFNLGANADISVVEYNEVDVSNSYYEEYIMGYSCGQHCLSNLLDCEVIGNIYENIELLN